MIVYSSKRFCPECDKVVQILGEDNQDAFCLHCFWAGPAKLTTFPGIAPSSSTKSMRA